MKPARNKNPLIAKIGKAALFVVVSILLLWAVVFFGIYIGYGNWKVRGHQEFARIGLSQVQPAAMMDELFDDCRHYIVYAGRESQSTWNSTAFFGDQYELTMQVPVDIKSKDSGSVIGEAKFYLNEIESVSVTSSGQIGASFSRNFRFNETQWKQVYDSGGDFGTIGFILKTTPVPNFQQYTNASRTSN